MSIKRILLPINGHDDVSSVADLTFALAGKVGAEVEVLHPHVPYYEAVTSVSEGGSAEQIMRDIQRERERFARDAKRRDDLQKSLATCRRSGDGTKSRNPRDPDPGNLHQPSVDQPDCQCR